MEVLIGYLTDLSFEKKTRIFEAKPEIPGSTTKKLYLIWVVYFYIICLLIITKKRLKKSNKHHE